MKVRTETLHLELFNSLPSSPVRGWLILYNIGGPSAKKYYLYFYTGSAWAKVTQS